MARLKKEINALYERVSQRVKLENEKLKEKLNNILAQNTNQDINKIKNDTERDYFMDANEALNYGIIDSIIKNREN